MTTRRNFGSKESAEDTLLGGCLGSRVLRLALLAGSGISEDGRKKAYLTESKESPKNARLNIRCYAGLFNGRPEPLTICRSPPKPSDCKNDQGDFLI